MPWFGDIFIPWVTTKDTSISRDTVEKNFVDAPPQVFELNENLEAGTYTVILNESVHERNESFSEQTDAVNSLPARHVTELPFAVGGDKGHIIVENATTSITPSQQMREGEADIRFLDADSFQPAITVEAYSEGDFSPTPEESVVPIPASATVSQTPQFTLTSADGDIDFYMYSTRENIAYTLPSDYTSVEQTAPVRLYNSNSERIYSDTRAIGVGVEMDNSIIRANYGSSQTNLSYFDGSWQAIGNVNFTGGTGYAPDFANYETTLEFVNGGDTSTCYKGLPLVEFTTDGETDFTFTSAESVTTGSSGNHYYSVTMDSSGYELVVIRTSSDGSFTENVDGISVTGLDSSTEYTFFTGIVPSSVAVSDLSRWMVNRGIWRRTMVQK